MKRFFLFPLLEVGVMAAVLSACGSSPNPQAKVNEWVDQTQDKVEAVVKQELHAQLDKTLDKTLDKAFDEAAATRSEAFDDERTESSTSASTTTASYEGIEIPHYESSRGGQLIHHTGFTLSYDADYKTPQWVAWELTSSEAQGTVPRAKRFEPDPKVRGAKAYHKDYTGSGYDRGHIAPAGDMKWSYQAMEESFYLSNICPQNRNLNRGDWKDLEELEREWALRYGAVAITAGPIYTNSRPERIGANRVAVPDAFYKVLLVDYPESPKAYGFIFRNEAGSRPLRSYQLTVDEVEQATGIDFFPSLPDDVERRIEAAKPSL